MRSFIPLLSLVLLSFANAQVDVEEEEFDVSEEVSSSVRPGQAQNPSPRIPLQNQVPQYQGPPADPSTAIPPGSCKWTPNQTGWPKTTEWAALNSAVKGRLLKPAPPAAACYGNGEGDCEAVSRGFGDSIWHADNPISNMWQNWNNYSCMPNGDHCSGQGYPVYVVEAREARDVKAAIDFARDKNIRLNVKSTGHDFLGRSVQPYSLSIWTHRLNSQKWYDTSFTPRGCRFSIPGSAVTVGSGAQWKQVTSEARDRNLMVVSGAYGTVSLGGFLSNGGHGALSAKYGLGADNVYEIDLVNPAGKYITANECQNQEYFWAMRGGGGSTYGVAVRYTIAAHPNVPVARYRTSLNGWTEITNWYRGWSKLAMNGASGYFNGYPGRGDSVSVDFSVPNMTQARLEALVEPIMATIELSEGSALGSISEELQAGEIAESESESDSESADRQRRYLRNSTVSVSRQRGTYSLHKSIYDHPDLLHNKKRDTHAASETFPGLGQSKLLATWLWSEEHLRHANLSSILQNSIDSPGQMLNDATMGYGTHRPPFMRGGGNAVNPAFRTAVMRPATELQWEGTDPKVLAQKTADSRRFVEVFKSIAPGGGTYANEADPFTPDWQHAFWGSNYPRLLAFKKQVDPWGVFYCRSCVGSEFWSDNSGQLCRL